MNKLFGFLRKPWFLSLVGVLALAVLVWFLGPYFGFAHSYPLEETRPRWISVGCLFGVWTLVQAWRAIAAWRRNHWMMDQLAGAAQPPQPDAAETAQAEELEALSGRFDEAMAVLKKSDVKHRLGGYYVYQLPWYLIIGPPGCGKTTALVNSGLRFPLAERFGQDPISSVGDTRNCDWWFSDEAVLLDTAGRYTTQDSWESVDSAAWLTLLQLLKKTRPRRPIDGVLIAVDIVDLFRKTENQRELLARAIKNRLADLNRFLVGHLPTYVVFTKTDLIAGFTEYFSELSREERDQAWGMTFPLDPLTGPSYTIDHFPSEFQKMVRQLKLRLHSRLRDTNDPGISASILAFPQQFFLIRETTDSFLKQIFRQDQTGPHAILRGVYFVSAETRGQPIDRVLGQWAATYGMAASVHSATSYVKRSFFLSGLFHDVILPECGLAGLNSHLERRRLWFRRAANAVTVVVAVLLTTAWLTSYLRNQAYIDEVDTQTRALQVQIDGLQPEEREPLRFLPLLNAMRNIPGGYGDEEVPLLAGFGLSQHGKLGEAARDSYDRTLEKTLLSAVILRLEEQIRALFAEPEKLHEALRVYLMLYDDGHYYPQTVEAWANAYWRHNWPREIPVTQRTDLQRHLEALFTEDPPTYRPHEFDRGLVERARAILNRPLPADRVFSRLQQMGVSEKYPDFNVSREAGHYADLVFKSKGGRALNAKVEALYTYKGYHQGFDAQVLQIIAALEKERWVLGKGISLDDKRTLVADVRELYLDEYIRQWRALLDSLVLVDGRGARGLSVILGLLSDKRESPMLLLFQAVARETDLARSVAEEEGILDKAIDLGQRSFFDRVDKLWDDVKPAPIEPEQAPEQRVSDAFSEIHALVAAEDGQVSEMETILDRLHPLYIYMDNYADREHRGSQLLKFLQEESQEAEAVAQVAQTLPAPLGGWLANLARNSADTVSGGELTELNKLWKAEVLQFCQRATHDRYPFQHGSAAETPLKDFGRLFGPNGDLDRFLNAHFSSSVDTTADPWRWIGEGEGISAETLAQFQRAGAIRESFFYGGANFGLEFKLTAVSMDDEVKRFELDLEGQVVTSKHEAGSSSTLKWPVPDGTGRVRITFADAIDKEFSVTEHGPWAWFRILDRATIKQIDDELYRVTFKLGSLRASLDLDTLSVRNRFPFSLTDLRGFHCPERL